MLDNKTTAIQNLKPNPVEDYSNTQSIVVNGIINFFEHLKYKITIQTNTGKINENLQDIKLLQDILKFSNKEVTVFGTGHFKPSGTFNFIEIVRVLKPVPEDKYFSKIPSAETAKQQIERQIAEKPYINWVEKIAGLWPGNETDEEFNQLLKELG